MRRIGNIRYQGEETSSRMELLPPSDKVYGFRLFINNSTRSSYSIGSVTSVSLLRRDNNLALAGMFVPESKRGQGISDVLMEVAFRIGEVTQLPLTTTAIIRKPLIAKLLYRYGFRPVSMATRAEILPPDSDSKILKVRISTSKQALDVIYDTWFTRVEGDVDETSGNPVVGLYTGYELIDSSQTIESRAKAVENFDRLRIYPKRVRELFG